MATNRIFSESEAAELIQRAAKLQERLANNEQTSLGVTLDELKKMAEDCGLDPSLIDQALVEPEDHSKASFLNLAEEHERVFEGELDANNMADVIESLASFVKLTPMIAIGKTQRFQVSNFNVFGQLGLSSRNGRTKLTFKQIPFMAYFVGLHVPLILSLVIGINLIASGHVIPGFATMFGLLGFGVFLFVRLAKLGKRKARELVEAMTTHISQALGQTNPKSER